MITDANRNVIVPKTAGTFDEVLSFRIPGYNYISPELVMEVPGGQTVPVTRGDEFQVWLADDFFDYSDSNNVGEHCIDVYVKYKI